MPLDLSSIGREGAVHERSWTSKDALLYADSANDLRLMIKLGSETDGEHLTSMTQGLSLEVSDEDPGRRFR